MTREDIYDSQVSPLMEQVMRLCREHDIPFITSFEISDDRSGAVDERMVCNSAYVPPNSTIKLKVAEKVISATSTDAEAGEWVSTSN